MTTLRSLWAPALLAFLTLACGGGSGGSSTTAPPASNWAPASQLDSYTGSSSSPQIGMDASGRALAVWEHDDGATFHILYSQYTPGQGWSWAVPLELESLDDARSPQIRMNANGFALAVWDQRSATASTVWASRYVPGHGWGAPERMDASPTNAFYPIVALDKNGDGLALWKQENTITQAADLWWCRFTASGGRTQPDLLRADSCIGSGDYPGMALAVDGAGNGWALWPDGLGVNPVLRGARFAPATGWSAPVSLQSGSTASALPQLAMNDSGTAIAVWSQLSGSTWQLQTTRSVPGSGWEPAQPLAATTEGQSQASVAIQANGDAMTVWTQYPAGQDLVKARRYVAGTGWETVANLSPDTLDDVEPTLVADGQGNWLAAWLHRAGAATRNIESAHYMAGSGWTVPSILSASGTDALFPSPVLVPGGRGGVLWNEYSAGQGKVWGRLLQ